MKEVVFILSEGQLFCPISGQQISGDKKYNRDVSSARFIYLPDFDGFFSIEPDLEIIADQVRKEFTARKEADENFREEFFDLFKEALKKEKGNNSIMIYSVFTSEMPDAPVGATIQFCIGMDNYPEGEDDPECEEQERTSNPRRRVGEVAQNKQFPFDFHLDN